MFHSCRSFKNGFIAFTLPILCGFFLVFSSLCHADKKHLVYFQDTAYELNVYKICGKLPGKTLMLIGGIQGNEPGGFLSADLYADMTLEKGNLIVVPRANFYSILLNHRGPHGDMNRKFAHEKATASMEDKIVNILKKLIEESDYLLNLHDGSGYYYPTYVNKWRNPMRFGQSIISDCAEYRIPGTNRVLNLEAMASRVIEEINPHIKTALYKFHFNNTRTADPNSPHKEQMKSATYYALTKHHIPAFGVETSKFLPSIHLKVQFHNMVINAFMRLFGIVPQYPGFAHASPVLKYLVVSINGQIPIVVKEHQKIKIRAGDKINVSHIEANYERGLSLDIKGYGDLNDFRKDFAITRNTTILVRKDNQKFAEIPVEITGAKKIDDAFESDNGSIEHLLVEAKGQRILLSNGDTLDLVEGDHLKLLDIISAGLPPSDLIVNFKGFVGNWKNNTGEDRGYDIDTASKLMLRYSLEKKGRLFEILATAGKKVYGRFFVRLDYAKFDYIIFEVNGSSHKVLAPGEQAYIKAEDKIRLMDIQTNLYDSSGIGLYVGGRKVKKGTFFRPAVLLPESSRHDGYDITIKNGRQSLGNVRISLQ